MQINNVIYIIELELGELGVWIVIEFLGDGLVIVRLRQKEVPTITSLSIRSKVHKFLF